VYVDSHCHVDRYPDPEAVLEAAASSRVVTVAVSDTPSSFKRLSAKVGPRSLLRLAVGIHPLTASRTTEHDMRLFGRLLEETDYVGEVGLDFSVRGRPTRRRQTEVFERILAEPPIRRKVLTVHSRQAEADTIRLLADARVHAILHWYLGALKHLDTALDAGLRFSINPSMLASRRGQRVIAALPPDRVLTETDGPHTTHDGRASEPRNVPALVAALAELWNEDFEVVRRRLFENMAALHAEAIGASEGTAAERTGPRVSAAGLQCAPVQLGLLPDAAAATAEASAADASANPAP
jgi:TatD DNase family protein